MVDVSVILVSYNTAGLLPRALQALQASGKGLAVEAIVVDNASRDGSVALLRSQFPQVKLIANEKNVGFGRANNQALPLASGRYILLLNTDAFLRPDTLQKTIRYMDGNPRCGILGVKLTNSDGSAQPSARANFPTPWNLFLRRTGLERLAPFRRARVVDDREWSQDAARECDWVAGCYYLVRREVIEEVGLFDPRYFLYYEEVDHCFRTKKAGWQIIYYPFTSVEHLGGESAKSEGPISEGGRQIARLEMESELLYTRKCFGLRAVLASVLLTSVADALSAAKALLRRRAARAAACAGHAALAWVFLWRTRLGAKATQ